MLDMTTLVSWNIQQGGGSRLDRIGTALVTHSPDIAVLPEFRAGESGRLLSNLLRDTGLTHQSVPTAAPQVNSILLASRLPFRQEPIPGLGDEAHRCILARFTGFNVVAVYSPQNLEKDPLFTTLIRAIRPLLAEPTVFCGDFNTGKHRIDQDGTSFTSPWIMDTLEAEGWIDSWRRQHGEKREFSWFSNVGNGFRIDHAFVSPGMVPVLGSVSYSHTEREEGRSDHSLMRLELGIARISATSQA